MSKKHKNEFPISTNRRQRDIFELAHVNMYGPMQTQSLGGSCYFLIFVGDCTRYTWVFFLRSKTEVFEKNLKNLLEVFEYDKIK